MEAPGLIRSFVVGADALGAFFGIEGVSEILMHSQSAIYRNMIQSKKLGMNQILARYRTHLALLVAYLIDFFLIEKESVLQLL